MARGVNKAIIVGNVGQDPEVRHTADGRAIANVSLATSMSWRDKATGENREQTEWHRVVFFNRLAEIVQEYVAKGSQLYIEGRIQTRKWQDQQGNDRYTTEIVANEMQMLGGRNQNAGQSFGAGGGAANNAPQNFGAPKPAAQSGGSQPSGSQAGGSQPAAPVGNIDDFDDDDIPF